MTDLLRKCRACVSFLTIDGLLYLENNIDNNKLIDYAIRVSRALTKELITKFEIDLTWTFVVLLAAHIIYL